MVNKEKLLALIDNSATQAKSFIEDFNDIMESFDFDSQFDYFIEKKNELLKKSNELFGDFEDLIKQVKDKVDDFSVTVPFDENKGEKISYEINDGKLDVEVTFKDENTTKNHKTSVLIPSDCDIEGISFTSNGIKKTATITIPKKKENATESKIEEEEVIKRDDETENVINERKNTSSKLGMKLKNNTEKFARMINKTKFVRRVQSKD